jgi:hypothetical protein
MLGASGAVYLLAAGGVALVLLRAGIVPAWIPGAMLGVGLWSCVAGAKGWVRAFALSGLAGVLMFRVAAVWLGEVDIAGLREVARANPGASIALVDEKRNIWHEVGLLSSALGQPMKRLESVDQIGEFLRAGGIVALSDEQAAQVIPEVRASLKAQAEIDWALEETSWKRWKGRLKFPYRDLILRGRAGIPDFDERLFRRFTLLQLKRDYR